MRYTVRTIFCLFLVALASCMRDKTDPGGSGGEEVPVTITIESGSRADNDPSTTGIHYGTDIDSRVDMIRVLGYRSSNGQLAFNETVQVDLSESNLAEGYVYGKIEIITGLFDFVFIANEGSDSQLSIMLDDEDYVGTFDKLTQLSFAGTAFDEAESIPMVTVVPRVTVLGDNTVDLNDGGMPLTGVWQVGMERLAIRIELELTMANDYAAGAALTFSNIPDRVYLLRSENIYSTGTRNKTACLSDTTPNGDGTTTLQWERIILPESWFEDAAKEENGVVVELTNGATTKKATLGLDPGTDYRMPRNYYFYVYGEVAEDDSEELDVDIVPAEWDLKILDPTENLSLHVSALRANVSEQNMARIYFWADTEDVSIDLQTLDGDNVDDLFYGLTGSTPSNFHYVWDAAAGQGSGYFDIVTDRDLPGVLPGTDGTHGLWLNAGGLKRLITVNAIIPNTWAALPYVGAFWKNEQMGERIISLPDLGAWTATASENWIVLSSTRSMDANLWTDNPGNAEYFPVQDGTSSISGTGRVLLRIGLTGFNPDSSTPRYETVTVTGNSTYTIYVRQGEAADYVMRPNDPATTWTGDRSLAARFVPYNVTAPIYNAGSTAQYVQLDERFPNINPFEGGGVFTDFPTQAGAFFQWASDANPRYAYHPTSTLTVWDGADQTQFWQNLEYTHETCPPGYRRPTDGSVSVPTDRKIETSEIRQSLWLTPEAEETVNSSNILAGYYADGFFDRREIVDAGMPNSAVSLDGGDSRVAYAGILFYNPNTNASLFFPDAGYRMVNSNLNAHGIFGYYWTASASERDDNGFAGQLLLSIADVMGISTMSCMNNDQFSVGATIRCVLDTSGG